MDTVIARARRLSEKRAPKSQKESAAVWCLSARAPATPNLCSLLSPASTMPRIFNFSAGPAVLPEPVLEDCKANLLDYKGCGMSVMELSHRGPEFMDIIARAEADLRSLLSIPDSYDVLFLQGGASGVFAALPLNLTAEGDTVDYVVTGSWSKKV